MTETPGGMLNSIGLQNPGVDAVIEKYADDVDRPGRRPGHRQRRRRVGRATTSRSSRRLDGVPGRRRHRAEHLCPNVGAGGLQFAIDAGAAGEVTAAVRRATDLPLLVKLSPNVADVRPIARAIADAGADALTADQHAVGDRRRAEPRRGRCSATSTAACPGPAIKPVALRIVYEVGQVVDIPVVAIGGVTELADVLDFLAVGAVAVQVGTAIFADPTLPVRLVDELADECRPSRAGDRTATSIGTALPRKAGGAVGEGRRVPALTPAAPAD